MPNFSSRTLVEKKSAMMNKPINKQDEQKRYEAS
jgi:hypothetical protein